MYRVEVVLANNHVRKASAKISALIFTVSMQLPHLPQLPQLPKLPGTENGHTFSTVVRWSLVGLGVFFVFNIFSLAYSWLSGTSLTDLAWLTLGNLATDSEDRTNFLLLGVGGEGHSGAELTDTIMVASYHHTDNTLALLSVPRDLWIKAPSGTGMRINAVYEAESERTGSSTAALESMSETASRITNLPIHYFLKVDFHAFTQIVDALGGIDVLVEKEISDPLYPCPDEVNYCPFSISAGAQTIDGTVALKYARSRKTTSDFDRAKRQQQIMEALREKALSLDVLGSPRKMKKIYDAVASNIVTNLSWREIIRLGGIASEFHRGNIANVVISDNPAETGGLLYAPPRESYGGAAVLLPVGDDFQKIHLLAGVLFGHPKILIEKTPVEVLNASGRPRLAERAAYYLNRYGINAVKANNYPDRAVFPASTIYFYGEAEPTELTSQIGKFVTGTTAIGPAELASRGYAVTVVVGQDFKMPTDE